MEFVKITCKTLGAQMEQFSDFLLIPLLKLCERTNKVFVIRAQATINEYIKVAPIAKMYLGKFTDAMKSPNKGLKAAVAESLELLVSLLEKFESDSIDVWEKLIVEGVVDAAPQVRESMRKVYFVIQKKNVELAKKIYENSSTQTQKLLIEGPKQASIAKRPTTLRPSGPIKANPNSSVTGGAQRVLKTTDSPSLTPGSKAARVVKHSTNGLLSTPIKTGLKTSVSLSDTLKPSASSKLTSCISAGQLSSTVATTVRTEIAHAVSSTRSSDWASRLKSFESLINLIQNEDSVQLILVSKSASQRLFDILLVGLSDTHFRVLDIAIRFGLALLPLCSFDLLPDASMFDNMLAKAIYLVVNPQFKGKSCQELAPLLIDCMKTWIVDQWKFISALSVAYSKPEATTSLKARLLIMSRIVSELEQAEFTTPEHEITFSNPPYFFIRILKF